MRKYLLAHLSFSGRLVSFACALRAEHLRVFSRLTKTLLCNCSSHSSVKKLTVAKRVISATEQNI